MGLAGQRVKQRISVDPQNKAWANDTSKAGYKMLERMGWSAGSGLGRSGDGMASHIKVSLKQNNLGVGATAKTADNWLENTLGFASLLADLNKRIAEEGDAAQDETQEDELTHGAQLSEDVPKMKKRKKKSSLVEKADETDKVEEPKKKKRKQRDATDDEAEPTESKKISKKIKSLETAEGSPSEDKTEKKKSKKQKRRADAEDLNEPDAEESRKEKKRKRKEAKQQAESKDVEDEEVQPKPALQAIDRLAHRKKYLRNKNVASFSATDLSQILGVRPVAAAPVVEHKESSSKKPEPTPSATPSNTVNAGVSVSDYFAEKMKSRGIKFRGTAPPPAEERPSFGGLGLTANLNEEEEEDRRTFGGRGLGAGSQKESRPRLGMSSFVKAVETSVETVVKSVETAAKSSETTAAKSVEAVIAPSTKGQKSSKSKRDKWGNKTQ